MDRKSVSIAVAIAAALFAANPARAQTIIDDWNQAKLPPPPRSNRLRWYRKRPRSW